MAGDRARALAPGSPPPAVAQAALFYLSDGCQAPLHPLSRESPRTASPSPSAQPPAPAGGANAALRCSQGSGWKFEPLLGEELDLRRVTWRLPPELIPRLSASSRRSSDSAELPRGPPEDGGGGLRGTGGEGGDRHTPTHTHLGSGLQPEPASARLPIKAWL